MDTSQLQEEAIQVHGTLSSIPSENSGGFPSFSELLPYSLKIQAASSPALAHQYLKEATTKWEFDPHLSPFLRELSQRVYGHPEPWSCDPIGDLKHQPVPRLTHRYPHRALLHVTPQCVVHCRFCFRRDHLTQLVDTLYLQPFEGAFAYLEQQKDIQEIILTGGDPLSLSETEMEALFQRLCSLTHLEVIRIHTRALVSLPRRWPLKEPPSWVKTAQKNNKQITIVHHINHCDELTEDFKTTVKALGREGLQQLSQTVLLRNVNDDSTSLQSLFSRLYNWGIIPLYLHHPDWVAKTFGYRMSLDEGWNLYASLRGFLSGPALPSYVVDLPQGRGKVPVQDILSSPLEKGFCPQSQLNYAVYQVKKLPTLKKSFMDQDVLKNNYLYLDLFPCGKNSNCLR